MAYSLEGVREGMMQALGHARCLLLCEHALDWHREFDAADPSYGVTGPHCVSQAVRDCHEELVAFLMGEGVVDTLEAVEVDEQHRATEATVTDSTLGAASAVSETATELGGALGIALLGSLGTAVYRSTLTGKLPAMISPSTTAASKSTLGGAVDAATHLHPQLADGLLHAAKVAFTHGFVVAAAAAAAITAATATITAITLRNARPEPVAEPGMP